MRQLWLLPALLLPASALAFAEWSPVSSPESPSGGDHYFSDGEALYTSSISGRVYGTTDHGGTWTEVGGGLDDEYAPLADMIRVGDTFLMSRSSFEDRNFRSTFNGESWTPWELIPYQDDELRSFVAIGSTLFAVFPGPEPRRSDDLGETWTPLDLPDGAATYTLFSYDGRLFAADNGFDEGLLYRSEDLGESWVTLGSELDNSSVLCHAMLGNTLLISQYLGGGHGSVWASPNYGDTWSEITTIPTWYNINGMALADDGRLAIGASSGSDGGSIFITADLVTWESYTGDLTSLPVNELLSHDGWFYKTGGTVASYHAQHPSVVAVPGGDAAAIVALHARPNPTHGVTTLALDLAADADVRVDVFDATGREVASLHRGALDAGRHALTWDGRDGAGREMAAGVYVVRVQMGNQTRFERITRLR
jgi:photosystem II stability/assembly factor-like uncharacterized protein